MTTVMVNQFDSILVTLLNRCRTAYRRQGGPLCRRAIHCTRRDNKGRLAYLFALQYGNLKKGGGASDGAWRTLKFFRGPVLFEGKTPHFYRLLMNIPLSPDLLFSGVAGNEIPRR